jgi:CubicO group peptidase (beta-lactamase class C family)
MRLRELLLAFAVLGVAALAGAGVRAAPPLPPQPAGVPWPTEDWPAGEPGAGVDRAALERAADELFRPAGRGGLPDTRALLAVAGGRIVLERYATGFGPDTRFRSWSMAKSVTQCLTGILVRDGRLELDAPVPVPAWQRGRDPRAAIRLREVLNMTTGLDNADGGDGADSRVAQLFFGEGAMDTLAFAEDAELAHEPGTYWAYSTATSQILAGIVGRTVGGGREGVRAFAERELAAPLGIESLVLEFDAAETMLGGGYVFANARDWARLGLLYLRDGRWDGRRVLPEGWVEFTRTPAPAPNNGTYGAHFWLTAEPGPEQWGTLGPEVESFQMSGNGGQYVVIVPGRDLVVVRLGEMQAVSWAELNAGLSALIRAFPVRDAAP